jgi:NAD(P)-dependent dehydrogenase (short-subunit alcohol dehydrogenase family)
MSYDFRGKTLFITGAGRGIGRSVALRFSREGARVAIADVDRATAEKTSREILSSGGDSIALPIDVVDAKQAENAVKTTWERYGPIDFLVNNAGVSTMNHFVSLTEKEWDFVMDVNAKGVFLVMQAVLKRMISHEYGEYKPRIVNIASKAGKDPGTLLAHYAASKHAVIGLTRAAAREFASYGITINCICPAFVQTSMQERELVWESKLRGISPESITAEQVQKTPLGRLEKPDDVASVVAFLCSRDADFMTAQAINVDGGIVVS